MHIDLSISELYLRVHSTRAIIYTESMLSEISQVIWRFLEKKMWTFKKVERMM